MWWALKFLLASWRDVNFGCNVFKVVLCLYKSKPYSFNILFDYSVSNLDFKGFLGFLFSLESDFLAFFVHISLENHSCTYPWHSSLLCRLVLALAFKRHVSHVFGKQFGGNKNVLLHRRWFLFFSVARRCGEEGHRVAECSQAEATRTVTGEDGTVRFTS